MFAKIIPFFKGAGTWFLKTSFGVVMGRVAIFATLQLILWGFSKIGTDHGVMSPFQVMTDTLTLFDALETLLVEWPTVVWAFNYFHIPYAITVFYSAMVSSWLMGLIVRASVR